MLSVNLAFIKESKVKSTKVGLTNLLYSSVRRSLVNFSLSALVAVGAAGIAGFSLPCFADTDDMTRLEIRFFQHNYPKDSQEARLDRLEKMVFGETKTGSEGERLARLVGAVPAGESTPPAGTASGSQSDSLVDEPRARTSSPGSSTSSSSSGSQSSYENDAPRSTSRKSSSPPPQATADNDDDDTVKTDEKYPAVTAIEQKTLGKDYAGEPVNKRLARLETKVFGKPSSNSLDLSDRVDALKQKTGIDVAKMAPKGADWADDDDDIAVNPRAPQRPRGDNYMASTNPREDAMSFSGRNLLEDMQKAFGTTGSGSSYGGSSYAGTPARRGGGSPISENPGGMGLNQQVSALETEIFQKNYSHDPLPTRLNRLEATVFPSDKTLSEKSLPDRVANLVAKVPISTPSSTRKTARAYQDDDLNDLMNGSAMSGSGMTGMTGMTGMGMSGTGMSMSNSSMTNMSNNTTPKKSGGLGKIVNSLGNMLSGGNNYTGGYPMNGGALAVDPTTGMLYDPTTGNLINPNTGQVVGRRASAYNSYGGTGYGTGYGSPYGYGGGFNSGFAPLNRGGFGMSPIGGMRMGGMGMGGMGMGGMGMGGMWP
jgi:hypothetical protein